ncbi:DUF3221 domain-containing protein [Bhargavaea ullalensis]|uniref:DUF3221 domain-containing protein n=1 Tax=Bhargavaea ullalensis TaxID=1265685 RepID=A0ABV2G889_9BACL
MKRLMGVMLGLAVFVAGCGQAEEDPIADEMVIDGTVLEVEVGRVLVAENIDPETYGKIRGKDWQEMSEEGIMLIFIGFEEADRLKPGDRVKAQIEGGVDESYPAQAEASEIEVVGGFEDE